MEYMEQQMQQQIEAGLSNAEQCYARIAELEDQNAALAAQVESLLDDRKAFVKKEFQLLKEIERIEIELKKHDEQDAALTANMAEFQRLHAELNAILHPDGDGPVNPSLCDLVSYVRSDRQEMAAQLHVLKTAAKFILNSKRRLAKRKAYAALADAVNKTPDQCLAPVRQE